MSEKDDKIRAFLTNAKGKLSVTLGWHADGGRIFTEFDNVPADIMAGLSRVVADGLVRAHGGQKPQDKSTGKPGKEEKGPPEGPITVSAKLYRDPTLKFVDTKHGNRAVGNIYIEDDQGIRYSFGIWGGEGERAVSGLNEGDRIKVEGKLVKDGKFNNIESPNLLEPNFKAKEEPPYEPPVHTNEDDIPF